MRTDIFHSPAPKAIFILCMLVSGSVLLFYAKKNPHPKFRPKMGELVLVGMIFFGISFVITSMTAGLFEQENLDEQAKKAKSRRAPKATSGKSGLETDDAGGADSDNIFAEEAPPFVPSE